MVFHQIKVYFLHALSATLYKSHDGLFGEFALLGTNPEKYKTGNGLNSLFIKKYAVSLVQKR
jgi:hypothetical protein